MAEVKTATKTKNIDIFKAWCKGCGICVAFCPKKVLALDDSGVPYVKDLEQCSTCGLCELRCPDFAITVQKRKDEDRSGKKREEAESSE
jgi:2-oxoglutarate ferredoxin oxidoreductase subunit delta